MTYLRAALLSSVTFSLFAAVGQADTNKVLLDQNGDANSALIEQDGNGNTAGIHGNTTKPNSGINQLGSDNDINFLQRGDGNSIGTGDAFRQTGNQNTADVDQLGNGNEFSYLIQSGGAASALANELFILQDGDGNRVKEVRQTRTGGTVENSASIAQDGNDNLVGGRTRQQGAGNMLDFRQSGLDNIIAPVNNVAGAFGITTDQHSVSQNGLNNSILVEQTGSMNALRAAQQHGDNNSMSLTLSGVGNGATGLLPDVLAASGVEDASIWQVGSGNSLVLAAFGDDNAYGVAQEGSNNVVNGTVTGSGNALGLGQFGDSNTVDLTISGNLNTAALIQIGTGNDSLFTVTGDGNKIDGKQDGTGNTAKVTQGGANNVANFVQIGVANSVTIDQ